MTNDRHSPEYQFEASDTATTTDSVVASMKAREQAQQADAAYLDHLADLVAARIRQRPTLQPYDAKRAFEKTADEQWRAGVNHELGEAREMITTLAHLFDKALDRLDELERSVAVLSDKAAGRK